MAAGLGFKTFTTGEVLTAADTNGYLMQGVLVFASAAARDAAITSPQEGQCCYLKDTDAVLTYSGAAWVGFDDSNAIQNSIVDAKGDIISATADNTPARLALGTNGQVLTVDTTTATGLKYATPTASWPTAVGASVYNQGGNISYTANVETLLTATTSDYDTNSFWAVSPNPSRLTIPSGYAGKYLLTITARVNAGSGYVYMFLYKNGARVATGLESGFIARQMGLASNTTAVTGTVVLNCAVGDYFQVYYQADLTTGAQATWMRYSLSYQGA
jgi:hypothetical protein